MAKAEIKVTVHVDIDQAVRDFITARLVASDWQPDKELPCGCSPEALCAYHAEQRAVDHYHPGTIR